MSVLYFLGLVFLVFIVTALIFFITEIRSTYKKSGSKSCHKIVNVAPEEEIDSDKMISLIRGGYILINLQANHKREYDERMFNKHFMYFIKHHVDDIKAIEGNIYV